MVLTAVYREFFAAVAASAGALTGLLFVAVTVTSRERQKAGPAVIGQVRAAAALMAFSNALAVSLFALAPGTGVRWPAAILGVIGLLFTAAGTRSILSSPSTTNQRFRQLRLLSLMLLIFGTELVTGIVLIADPRRTTAVDVLCDALVVSVLVGIARAWELVGDRSTGIIASLAVLAHHAPGTVGQDAAGRADDSSAHETSDHRAGLTSRYSRAPG
jgi:hypothetical protein